LPEALLVEAKVRAARQGAKLKDVIAEAIEQGFEAMAKNKTSKLENARVVEPDGGGLAFVECEPSPEIAKMSVDEILRLEQETLMQEDLRSAGITD